MRRPFIISFSQPFVCIRLDGLLFPGELPLEKESNGFVRVAFTSLSPRCFWLPLSPCGPQMYWPVFLPNLNVVFEEASSIPSIALFFSPLSSQSRVSASFAHEPGLNRLFPRLHLNTPPPAAMLSLSNSRPFLFGPSPRGRLTMSRSFETGFEFRFSSHAIIGGERRDFFRRFLKCPARAAGLRLLPQPGQNFFRDEAPPSLIVCSVCLQLAANRQTQLFQLPLPERPRLSSMTRH